MLQTAKRNSAGILQLPSDLGYVTSSAAPLPPQLLSCFSQTVSDHLLHGQCTKAKICYLGVQATRSQRENQAQTSQNGYS